MGPKELKLLGEGTSKKTIKCGTFGASSLEDRQIATGDFEGRLCVWDLENQKR